MCVYVCAIHQHYLQQMKMKIRCLEGFGPQKAGYRYQKKQTLGKGKRKNYHLANCFCSLASGKQAHDITAMSHCAHVSVRQDHSSLFLELFFKSTPLNQDYILIDRQTEKPQMHKLLHHTVDRRLDFHSSCPKPNILSTGNQDCQRSPMPRAGNLSLEPSSGPPICNTKS